LQVDLCDTFSEVIAFAQSGVKAKQQTQIDDFLFYDSTVDYLVSKLEALTN